MVVSPGLGLLSAFQVNLFPVIEERWKGFGVLSEGFLGYVEIVGVFKHLEFPLAGRVDKESSVFLGAISRPSVGREKLLGIHPLAQVFHSGETSAVPQVEGYYDNVGHGFTLGVGSSPTRIHTPQAI